MTTRKYTIRLFPTLTQIRLLGAHVDARCFVWNWALETMEQRYKEEKENDPNCKPKQDWNRLNADLVILRNSLSQGNMLRILNKHHTRSAIEDLHTAYKNFFQREKKKIKGKNPRNPYGKPQPRKWREADQIWMPDGCRVTGRKLRASGMHLKLAREIPTEGKIGASVRIKYSSGKWYASFSVEIPDKVITPVEPTNLVGIDIGFRKYLTISDGVIIENPRWTRQYARKLTHWQRKLSRQKKGSNRWKKTKKHIGKIHAGIANRRKHYAHLISKQVSNNYDAVCIETHSLENQKTRFGKSLSDVGHGHFRACLTYKLADRGKQLVEVDPYFPSSKLCHVCGTKNTELKFEEKWTCSICGTTHDRDFNASKNLELEGRQQVTADVLQTA
jgi:putative transposase